jgi:hypothetical protein
LRAVRGLGRDITVEQVDDDGTRRGHTYVSEKFATMEWLFGYLTQVNLSRDSAHQIHLDNVAVELWLKNYCTANPTDLLVEATRKLVLFMSKKAWP